MVALVTVLYVGGKDVIDGSLTVGDLVAFSFALAAARVPAAHDVVHRRAGRAGVRVSGAGAGGDGRRAADHRGRVAAGAATGPGRGVVLGRVASRTTADRDVLHDFDLELAGGESVALVGPTGCGKSTVAR